MVNDVLETLPVDLRSLQIVCPELTANAVVEFLLAHNQLRSLNVEAPFTSERGHDADRELVKTICRERRPSVQLHVR